MDKEIGLGYLGPDEYAAELDRRATEGHTAQVEAYADKLDRLTVWLVTLTIVLVGQTTVLLAITAEEHFPGSGKVALLLTPLIVVWSCCFSGSRSVRAGHDVCA